MKIMCECIDCHECGGTGTVWFSFGGKYMGIRRCDDLDEMELCEECGGTGVSSTCWECQQDCEDDMDELC